jgi:hypothetical protein
VDCLLPTDNERAFLESFQKLFLPAISSQDGYLDCLMLVVTEEPKIGELLRYRIDITFASEPQRQKWVKSKLHEDVFGQLSALTSEYSAVHLTKVN